VYSYLGEANVGSLLTEALTADVEAVLADETGLVGAHAAVRLVLELASQNFFLYLVFCPNIFPGKSIHPATPSRVSPLLSFFLLLNFPLSPCRCFFPSHHNPPRNFPNWGLGEYFRLPSARALAVAARARVPDGFVRHLDGRFG